VPVGATAQIRGHTVGDQLRGSVAALCSTSTSRLWPIMSHIPAVGAGLAVAGLLSIPAIKGFLSQIRTREQRVEIYEDKDGKATPESMRAYRTTIPKTLVVLSASVGSGISIAQAVFSHRVGDRFVENWIISGTWVRLCPSSRAKQFLSGSVANQSLCSLYWCFKPQ
jgi:hypothetical protein